MPMPLGLMVEIVNGSWGLHSRWASDEPDVANVPSGLSFSTTMPGGFEQMSCTLARKPGLDYPDLAEFATVTVYGVGGEIAWQGRLQSSPRASGDRLAISPAAVGWQAALDDDRSARMIYWDCDLTKWQPASTQRKLNLAAASQDCQDPQLTTDTTTGRPALTVGITFDIARLNVAEAWYDAKGLPLAGIWYAWRIGNISPADTNWSWVAYLCTDDVASGLDGSGNLRAAGPGTGSVGATATRKFALLQTIYGVGLTGLQGIQEPVFWTFVGVAGTHGLPIRGVLTATGGLGVLASDVVQHAVQTWAPRLATGRNSVSTIEPTAFVIPQLAFLDPTTASTIITEALKYQPLMDWWVDEGPTFHMASWANHGRDWRARVGPSGLQETGPDVNRMCNRVIVTYNDVAGVARTVGPTGSNANTIDDTLADTDPSNPVTAAGLVKYPPNFPNIGVSTAAGAAAVGQRFLLEQKAKSTAGQASIALYAEDSHGVLWPAWMLRAGDRITFVDAHDPVPRRIVRTQYDDKSKVCQVDLDSPAQDLDALLAQYGAALTGIGV